MGRVSGGLVEIVLPFSVRGQIERAIEEDFQRCGSYREVGGWLYAEPPRLTRIVYATEATRVSGSSDCSLELPTEKLPGWTMVGSWHSHGEHNGELSETDMDAMEAALGFLGDEPLWIEIVAHSFHASDLTARLCWPRADGVVCFEDALLVDDPVWTPPRTATDRLV